VSHDHVTCHISQCDITQMKSHDNCGKVVHRLCSNCISSVQEIHENSIEFFLLSTDKGAVGFILAQELAILTSDYCVLSQERIGYRIGNIHQLNLSPRSPLIH